MGKPGRDLKEKYSSGFMRVTGIEPPSSADKLVLLVNCIASYGSVPEYRSYAKSLNNATGGKSFFPQFCIAESYLFGSSDGEASKPIKSNLPVSFEHFLRLSKEFPKEATPFYKLAQISKIQKEDRWKSFAEEFLRLERRPHKKEWKVKVSKP
jgi:hypothetical protein